MITHKNFLKFRVLYIKLLPLHKTKKHENEHHKDIEPNIGQKRLHKRSKQQLVCGLSFGHKRRNRRQGNDFERCNQQDHNTFCNTAYHWHNFVENDLVGTNCPTNISYWRNNRRINICTHNKLCEESRSHYRTDLRSIRGRCPRLNIIDVRSRIQRNRISGSSTDIARLRAYAFHVQDRHTQGFWEIYERRIHRNSRNRHFLPCKLHCRTVHSCI